MPSIEEGLRDKIATAGLGAVESTTGWSITIGLLPASPDEAIVITKSGGEPPDPKWLLDFPHFQIRVRGAKGNYQGAQSKAQDIKDLLLGIASQDVSGDRWVSLTMLSDIAFMGYDQNQRPNFTLNIRMIIEPGVPGTTNRQAI